MTPEPPASSDGPSLPSRHRPSLGNLAKDTTEMDLWDFEDDLDLESEPLEPQAPRPSGREIPAPRERSPENPLDPDKAPATKAAGGEDKVRMNVTKARAKKNPSGPVSGVSKPEPEFDDLEHWEDPTLTPEIEDLPAVVLPEMVEPEMQAEPEKKVVKPVTPTPAVAPPPPDDDEFSPVPREGVGSVSLRPHLKLSKIERLGLILLLVLLLGGGGTVFLWSLNRLPVDSVKAESNDFPIKGDDVTITSATSYWRAPIREGPDADTFRRGTELLPVVELAVTGGPSAIRILFRSDDQSVIGDAVTRLVRGEERLKIPATAGFDDPGMHAAYRTGESKPWTIEVYEAPSGKGLKKLFEMNISTDRR